MATLMKRTGKHGHISFRVQVRRKGAVTLSATFGKRSEAFRWAQMTEGAVLEGRHAKVAEAKRHTLADAIDRYLTAVLPHKGASSIRKQTQQLGWWQSRLGYCLLADITPALVSEHRDALAREDRADATVKLYLAALSHVFTVAVNEWQWCEENPLRKVRKPKRSHGRVRYLSDDERERLLLACYASRNPYLSLVVTLALSTGARKMELLSLTWPDVNLKRGVITLQQTKNGETRVLPLTGHALDLMRHQWNRIKRLIHCT